MLRDSKRIYSLQVYRGLAALMVVLFHITNFSRERFNVEFLGKTFSFGYVGVDFFFVLSGFIIYFVNRGQIGKPQELSKYLSKRLLRVYPIYWLVTTAKIVVLLLLPSFAKPYETHVLVILKSYFLFPQQSNLPIIGAAWTLSHEVMFYLIFGLAIAFGIFWFRRIFAMWGVSILAYQIIRVVIGPTFQSHYLLDFVFNERNLEFLLGCLSAYLVLNHQISYRLWAIGLGAVLFLLSSLFVNAGGAVGSYTLFFGIPSFLIVTGSAALESKQQIHLPSPLIFLGDASYSIYLTHALFINICTLVLTKFDLMTRFGPTLPLLLLAVFSITGGCLVYLIVEKPLLSFINKQMAQPKSLSENLSSSPGIRILKAVWKVPEHRKNWH